VAGHAPLGEKRLNVLRKIDRFGGLSRAAREEEDRRSRRDAPNRTALTHGARHTSI
jgi:hypothetical protein